MLDFRLTVILVFSSILFLCLMIGILYVNIPVLQGIMNRKLNLILEMIADKTAWLSDYEDYDDEWMDYERWKKTII